MGRGPRIPEPAPGRPPRAPLSPGPAPPRRSKWTLFGDQWPGARAEPAPSWTLPRRDHAWTGAGLQDALSRVGWCGVVQGRVS